MELKFVMLQINGDSEFAACAARQLKLLASPPQWGHQEMSPITGTGGLPWARVHPSARSLAKANGGGGAPPCFRSTRKPMCVGTIKHNQHKHPSDAAT